ncbi:hypothetical protein CUMW_278930 [Citrus unshiu]|uniref:Serine-threonine/tyrosine-protein kinase catalytic domain-containing protein n=1 Tax=Citrus unshiu TaxID=55188 RepID=A0A2H5N6R0_CITUN|nr:hypothetical protein CUMW_278930 [Citrus unshiu]
MFNDGLTLHGYAKMALPQKVMEIVDPSLLLDHENERIRIEECLVAVVRTGVFCSMESPSERIQMTDVVAKLCAAREIFTGRITFSIFMEVEGQSKILAGDASMTGDVYSFGILLLEMFTRRRPTDNMFNDGLTLHGYAKMALPQKVMEIVDPSLLLDHENERIRIEECLVAVVRTGVFCSMESPSERIQMTDVVAKLCAAREILTGRSI